MEIRTTKDFHILKIHLLQIVLHINYIPLAQYQTFAHPKNTSNHSQYEKFHLHIFAAHHYMFLNVLLRRHLFLHKLAIRHHNQNLKYIP